MAKKFKTYCVNERIRVYEFPKNEKIVLFNVKEIIVTNSTHRLKTADGQKHIIPKSWQHINIDSEEDWVF